MGIRHHLTKKRKQRAGAYVGKGTYGCGFRPALLCRDEAERRPGKFSKLMSVYDAENEMRAHHILHTIDPDLNYFLYPEDMCIPAPPVSSNQINSCPHNFHNLIRTRAVIQSDGGDNLNNIQIRAADYPAFFHSLSNIIVGLERIHANGVAHCDIKPDNIVALRLADGKFHTRLIDFGLMVKSDILDYEAAGKSPFHEYVVFYSNYLFWPFEVRLVVPKIFNDAKTRHRFIKRDIDAFYATIPEDNTYVPARALRANLLSTGNVGIMADWYERMSRKDMYTSIFSGCDIHGLGMSLAQIYQRLIGHRDRGTYAPEIAVIDNVKSPGWKLVDGPLVDYSPASLAWHREVARDISRPLYTLIRQMITTNPQERAKATDVRVAYATILPAMERLFTVDNIRAHIKPFMTPEHSRNSPIENPPTPRSSSHSPLLTNTNVFSLTETDRPTLKESNSEWITIDLNGPKKGGGGRKTRRRHR